MFSKLPMVAISRDVRKPDQARSASGCSRTDCVVIRVMCHVLIDANTFPAHSASMRPEACNPLYLDVAHQPALLDNQKPGDYYARKQS